MCVDQYCLCGKKFLTMEQDLLSKQNHNFSILAILSTPHVLRIRNDGFSQISVANPSTNFNAHVFSSINVMYHVFLYFFICYFNGFKKKFVSLIPISWPGAVSITTTGTMVFFVLGFPDASHALVKYSL